MHDSSSQEPHDFQTPPETPQEASPRQSQVQNGIFSVTTILRRITAILSRIFAILIRLAKLGWQTGTSIPSADLRAAFAHLHPRKLARYTLLAIVGLYLLSGVYVVSSGEAAVVQRFGAVVVPKVSEGIHYRFPWPFEKETIVNVSEVRRETVGIVKDEPEHPLHIDDPKKLQVLSGDTNIIDYELIIQYQIRNPAHYLFTFQYPPYQLLRDAVRAAVTKSSAGVAIDDILTSERQTFQNSVKQEVQKILDTYESGLMVVGVNFQKAYPPDEVAQAFRDVSSAREDKSKKADEAEGYRNSVIPETRGEAQKMLAEAKGYAQQQINEAGGSAQAFNSILAEYRSNSQIYGADVTRFRLYLEKMEQVLSKVKLYVVKPGETVNLRFLSGKDSQFTTFPPQSSGGQ